jgi:hypothetical protein
MHKYGEYATLSRLSIEQKQPERFTFGQKFYINEVKKILNPKDMLLQRINDQNAHLTKTDWAQIRKLYENRNHGTRHIPDIKIVEHDSPESHQKRKKSNTHKSL